MNTKSLYVLVQDGGDGSYYPKFTLDRALMSKLERAYDEGKMDYENGIGVDGDGFHYTVINVPIDSSAESLGIDTISHDFADQFFTDEEDDE